MSSTADLAAGRPEDDRLLRGRGRFVTDTWANPLFVAFVRSPHARARIVAIDTSPAAAAEGVFLCWTGADCAGRLMPPPNPVLPAADPQRLPLLAGDRVIFLGQPVAAVVAKSQALARAAADEVLVDYEPLDARTGSNEDLGGSESCVSTGWALNGPSGNSGRYQVALEHQQPRLAPMALEPRAGTLQWDAGTQTLLAWMGVQAPARSRDDLAQTLAIDARQVRLITPDVGGAFGGKASLYPEDHVAALIARALNSTVQWAATRSEEFVSASHGRGARWSANLSADDNGHLVCLNASVHFDLGAWLPYSALVPLRNGVRILPGPYRIQQGEVRGTASLSHTAPVNIYRGAGRPEAALIMETLIDRLAHAAGIDPIELRRRNLRSPQELPATLPGGDWLDAGNYPALLEAACERFGYATERAQQAERRRRGELVGIGCALYIEPCGQGFETARVTALPDGRFEVATGSCSQGQGHSVSFARIAAQALGVAEARVTVIEGDTARCPDGIGALASRSTAIGGSAVLLAARELSHKLAAPSCSATQGVEAYPVCAEVRYQAPHEAWSAGCLLARLSVDSQTGVPDIERIVWVDDAGELISPSLAKGQLVGGLAQGLGQAMMERLVYDEQGQLLTGSLMDYAVPRADDMPAIEIHSLPTASLANALGVRGVGEAGCIGAPAALLNAALDALAPLGVEQLDFPLTSEKLWRAIQAAPQQPPGR